VQTVGMALKVPVIYKMCLFQFITGAIVPRFNEYKYYFMLDDLKFSEFAYGILFVMSCCTIIALVSLFDFVFKHFSYRQGMAVGLALTTVTTIFDLLFVLRWN
jgi:fucose permease